MKPVLTLALARATFDVPFAEDLAQRAFAAADRTGLPTIGPRELLFDADSARAAIAGIDPASVSGVLLIQATFTDATMTVEIARAFAGTPIAIWAFPEPRLGGRLRLNAFCGLNLAAHALQRAGIAHGWLYALPEASHIVEFLRDLAVPNQARRSRQRLARPLDDTVKAAAERIDARLGGRRIGLIGEHPVGFDTCRYEPEALVALAGIAVAPIPLDETFARARAVPDTAIAARRLKAARDYEGLDSVDPAQLGRSLALHAALEDIARERGLDALAMRCWPETFTEFGCAVCGPLGMLTEAGTPCACEADVYGALTALLMQEAAGSPAWLVDIVDMDTASDTAVLWHCGSAPLSMRDPEAAARAQIHSNRRMPLLAEFPLKPGRITLARVSQARNRPLLVLGSGEVLRAPKSFTGTSAVVSLKGGIAPALATLVDEGIEHHLAITYGDQRDLLEAWAGHRGLPVLDLTA
ncbi:MAG: hypothetical protein LDL25_00770 [Hyphomicrobiales bacterium]|uniref:L-fucose/L-arabinose isomerase family protein n=1 Tax=Rhabdaerophilum calidifontis TaxID=2604328 RepID=UPI00123C68F5|nr:hypothetical protein [Rhabdaerophilum calidifontis]MCA1951593.1 hypothetical protein [Hyphomicrobiales bacterium]MCA1998297.1 hypothetical protein [Hyphomicrobiales bacterium]